LSFLSFFFSIREKKLLIHSLRVEANGEQLRYNWSIDGFHHFKQKNLIY
jgi:hypothetical protein